MRYENRVSFLVYGRYALFSDPITRTGGEKFSYPVPTYQALKGVAESIYWKPTFQWIIEAVRVMKPIQTQTKGVRPLKYGGGNSLSIYTYLYDVAYQVQAHFEWNENRPELREDRNEDKHFQIARRMLERGGRRDIFLGTRECQGYVEPCIFGEDTGAYDRIAELSFGLMFHSFGYPDETGREELTARLWRPKMERGVIRFERPETCALVRHIKPRKAKSFILGETCAPAAFLEEDEGI